MPEPARRLPPPDRTRQASDLHRPDSVLGQGRTGGSAATVWASGPSRAAPPRDPAYENPPGFIEVTPENFRTRVSEHFTLGQFLTKGQDDVWPKYVALDRRLVDKLELTLEELSRRGHPSRGFVVMSGFRTPDYNESGGDPSGRSAVSRHLYGDAADVYPDESGRGSIDDLNRDGRRDVRDARGRLPPRRRPSRRGIRSWRAGSASIPATARTAPSSTSTPAASGRAGRARLRRSRRVSRGDSSRAFGL